MSAIGNAKPDVSRTTPFTNILVRRISADQVRHRPRQRLQLATAVLFKYSITTIAAAINDVGMGAAVGAAGMQAAWVDGRYN